MGLTVGYSPYRRSWRGLSTGLKLTPSSVATCLLWIGGTDPATELAQSQVRFGECRGARG